MSIQFTQYLRPDGRRSSVEIDRPADIQKLADQFIATGGYFECEELMTGHASVTAGHPVAVEEDIGDVAICVVRNGPGVEGAVDEVVKRAVKWATEKGLIK